LLNYESPIDNFNTPYPIFERVYGIPLCNCQFTSNIDGVGYHRTQEHNDICIHCDHYVFYGSEMDITDVVERKPWGYSDEVVEAVRTAYMASGNASTVARQFEISHLTVLNWIKLYKWEFQSKEAELSDELKAIWERCPNIVAVAKRTGISANVIRRLCKKYNWKEVKKVEKKKRKVLQVYSMQTVQKAKEMYESGIKPQKIAKELNVVRRTLSSWMEKYNWRKK